MAATAALCVAIFVIQSRHSSAGGCRAVAGALTAAALVLIVAPHAFGSHPIDHHPREAPRRLKAIAAIREEIDAAPEGTEVYSRIGASTASGPLMLQRPDLFPGLRRLLRHLLPDVIVDGRLCSSSSGIAKRWRGAARPEDRHLRSRTRRAAGGAPAGGRRKLGCE
jgi:hypothetical protein